MQITLLSGMVEEESEEEALEGAFEHAVLICKPGNAVERLQEVKWAIEDAGLIVCRERRTTFTQNEAILLLNIDQESDFAQRAIKHMCSGPCVALDIAGSGATRRLKVLVGPLRVTKARRVSPRCLTARFGTSDVRNGFCMDASRDAFDVAFLTPSYYFQIMDGVVSVKTPADVDRYVREVYMPPVQEHIHKMCVGRQWGGDPCSKLADFIATTNPFPPEAPDASLDTGTTEAEENAVAWSTQVFDSSVHLFSDEYGCVHNAGVFGVRMFPACWYFRVCEGRAGIYGCGLPHQEGIDAILKFLCDDLGAKRIVIINGRQDASVYVQGESVSLREKGAQSSSDARSMWEGLEGKWMEAIEERFREDAVAHAASHGNALAVMFQDEMMATTVKMFREIDESCVRTPRALLEASRGAFYARIPVCAELGLGVSDYDKLLQTCARAAVDANTAFVCCCHDGGARTTCLMAALSVYWMARWGFEEVAEAGDGEKSDETTASWKCVDGLVDALSESNGERAKRLVDAAVDNCSAVHSISACVSDAVKTSMSAKRSSFGKSAEFYVRRAHTYLQRYYMLIAFGAYCLQQNDMEQAMKLSGSSADFVFGASPTFKEWFHHPSNVAVKRGYTRGCSLEK